jgi:hypothetical protein
VVIRKGNKIADAHHTLREWQFILLGLVESHGVDIVPASPEYLIQFIEAIADQIACAAVYPLHQISKARERGRHKKGMCKLGIGEAVIILADQPVQIGRAAARVGYDKDRLLDLHLPVSAEKDLIDQPEKKVNELIDEVHEDEKHRKEPDAEMEAPI